MSEQYFKAKQHFFENWDLNKFQTNQEYSLGHQRLGSVKDEIHIGPCSQSFSQSTHAEIGGFGAGRQASNADQSACQGGNWEFAPARGIAEGWERALQTPCCKQGCDSSFPGFFSESKPVQKRGASE